MSERSGRIELERSVDSITVGVRHRVDMGDLQPLVVSIQRLGLLHPITVTPAGVLVCGRRRLEAVKQLGWRTMRVWVRTGLSDRLTYLLAQQDENALRKPLTLEEQAALYRELKKVIADDAADRQKQTRFGAAVEDFGEIDGAAESANQRGHGDTRREAAELVTQNASYNRLEEVSFLENVADDDNQPTKIRQLAQNELRAIHATGKVHPSYQRVKAAIDLLDNTGDEVDDTPADPDELEALAAKALNRAKDERARKAIEYRRRSAANAGTSRRTLRSFILTWSDLDGWSAHYDATEVGTELRDDDWAMFERVLAETTKFAAEARLARAG